MSNLDLKVNLALKQLKAQRQERLNHAKYANNDSTNSSKDKNLDQSPEDAEQSKLFVHRVVEEAISY